jgi:hypothetical protein
MTLALLRRHCGGSAARARLAIAAREPQQMATPADRGLHILVLANSMCHAVLMLAIDVIGKRHVNAGKAE